MLAEVQRWASTKQASWVEQSERFAVGIGVQSSDSIAGFDPKVGKAVYDTLSVC
jgi:hypothetical protein